MAAPEVIDLDRLSPQDLDEVHRTVLLEIDALSQNITQLHTAHTKYRQSLQSVQSLVASKDDKVPSLIPLTSSMYMFGEMREVQKVLVDVGTGYFVEKELEDAIQFFEKKIALVAEQLEKLQQIIQSKRNDVAKIRAAMQSRIQAMNRAQGAQQAR